MRGVILGQLLQNSSLFGARRPRKFSSETIVGQNSNIACLFQNTPARARSDCAKRPCFLERICVFERKKSSEFWDWRVVKMRKFAPRRRVSPRRYIRG